TTTPWTLPANRAVTVHPELDYAVVDAGDERLMVAQGLLESFAQRVGLDAPRVTATLKGAELEGTTLQHPFYDFEVPVVLGDHVTLESGTGAVHTAPGHGQDDYVLGRRYGLEVFNPVGDNGVYAADLPLFGGQFVFKANQAIVDTLRERGALVHHEDYAHSYPHCWRHKSPVIFRAT